LDALFIYAKTALYYSLYEIFKRKNHFSRDSPFERITGGKLFYWGKEIISNQIQRILDTF